MGRCVQLWLPAPVNHQPSRTSLDKLPFGVAGHSLNVGGYGRFAGSQSPRDDLFVDGAVKGLLKD